MGEKSLGGGRSTGRVGDGAGAVAPPASASISAVGCGRGADHIEMAIDGSASSKMLSQAHRLWMMAEMEWMMVRAEAVRAGGRPPTCGSTGLRRWRLGHLLRYPPADAAGSYRALAAAPAALQCTARRAEAMSGLLHHPSTRWLRDTQPTP